MTTIKTDGALETSALGTTALKGEATTISVYRGTRTYSEGSAYSPSAISVRREGGGARVRIRVGTNTGGAADFRLDKANAAALIDALKAVYPSL